MSLSSLIYEVPLRDNKRFYQGDIIDIFPFCIFGDKFKLLEEEKDAETYKLRRVDGLPEENKEILGALTIRLQRIILISQTCDIENNNNVMIAPIYSLREVLEDNRLTFGNANLIKSRRGVMKDWFYLPTYKNIIEDSFVDFQTIHYIPKTILAEEYLRKILIRLSDWGRHLFGWALADYVGRPIEDKSR